MSDNGENEEVMEEPEDVFLSAVMSKREEREMRQRVAVVKFLAVDETVTVPVIKPRYYGELLAWSLDWHIKADGWRVLTTSGFRMPEPLYTEVDDGSGECRNVLRDGTLFVEKSGVRLAVTVNVNPRDISSVMLTGAAMNEAAVQGFAAGVVRVCEEHNFYRGRNIMHGGWIRFVDVPARSWDSVILDKEVKDDIVANTVGFLARRRILANYGIPAKRGVLLVGKPGTGKTLVCKALMAENHDITCIVAKSACLEAEEYILELYELAYDLKPSIVFIEDIDLIAKDRVEWNYTTGSVLLTLLSVLDGIEECEEIVTVATTNHLETLDKAIGARPARFDRIIEIPCPDHEQRRQLVSNLCQRIPVGGDIQTHITNQTEGFTPAQIQEVLYSLALRYGGCDTADRPQSLDLTKEQVNRVVLRVRGRKGNRVGFAAATGDDL